MLTPQQNCSSRNFCSGSCDANKLDEEPIVLGTFRLERGPYYSQTVRFLRDPETQKLIAQVYNSSSENKNLPVYSVEENHIYLQSASQNSEVCINEKTLGEQDQVIENIAAGIFHVHGSQNVEEGYSLPFQLKVSSFENLEVFVQMSYDYFYYT